MEQNPTTIARVGDMQANGKRLLEDLLGQPLQDHQQVFIMVSNPAVPPDDEHRSRARAGFEQTWAKVEQHLRDQGVVGEEFDAVVDEARNNIRGIKGDAANPIRHNICASINTLVQYCAGS